ncbi:MAG: hypothetical protein P4N59_26780 [Negativicutes bacterium]|nr:hypothetical protein [Negativicutes bacterium]
MSEAPFEVAIKILADLLDKSSLYDWVNSGDLSYLKHAGRPVRHPLPGVGVGSRFIDCLTDLSGYDSESLAKKLLKVNTRAIDSFFNISVAVD